MNILPYYLSNLFFVIRNHTTKVSIKYRDVTDVTARALSSEENADEDL